MLKKKISKNEGGHSINILVKTEWDLLISEIESKAVSKSSVLEQCDTSEMQEPLELLPLEQQLKVSDKVMQQSANCKSCGGIQLIYENKLLCQSCGRETICSLAYISEDTPHPIKYCGVQNKGFTTMQIKGRGSKSYQRTLLKTCANYSLYSSTTTYKELCNWNSQSSGIKLPKNVLEDANNMFAAIKAHGHVFRKDVKKGVQGACIYYACHMNDISRTPTEIAEIVGIAEKFLSSGDRILQGLNEQKVICIPTSVNSVENYVTRYFELLSIDIKYKDFVLDIIEQAEKDKLHVLQDNRNNTKCVGAIYMLIDRVKELHHITRESIDAICRISKTTFVKYYMLLCKYYRRFVPIFVKHRIPLKSIWREDIHNPKEFVQPRRSKKYTKSVQCKVIRKRKEIVLESDDLSISTDVLDVPDVEVETTKFDEPEKHEKPKAQRKDNISDICDSSDIIKKISELCSQKIEEESVDSISKFRQFMTESKLTTRRFSRRSVY